MAFQQRQIRRIVGNNGGRSVTLDPVFGPRSRILYPLRSYCIVQYVLA